MKNADINDYVPWRDGSIPGDRFREEVAKKYIDDRIKAPLWGKEEIALREALGDVADGSQLIEIAFGTGRFLRFYESRNFSVTAVEPSLDMIKTGLDYFEDKFAFSNIPILLSSAMAISLPHSNYDAVVSMRFVGCILTMSDTRKCLLEMARLVKSNGVVVFDLNVRRRNFLDDTEIDEESVIGYQLSRRQVEKFLATASLEPIKTYNHETKKEFERNIFVCKRCPNANFKY